MSDVATSLADDNVSLLRPDLDICTPREGELDSISSVVERSSNSTGSPVASSKDNIMKNLKQDQHQETCLCKIVPCSAVDNGHSKVVSKGEIISVNLNTTAEMDVSFIEHSSIQDFDVSKEFQGNTESLPKDCLFPTKNIVTAKQSSAFVEDRLVNVEPPSKNHNYNSAFKKNGSFAGINEAVVTQIEKPSWNSENFHVIDMESSCDDTSPYVVHEGEMVCFSGQSNTGNFAAESSGCVVNTCEENDDRAGISAQEADSNSFPAVFIGTSSRTCMIREVSNSESSKDGAARERKKNVEFDDNAFERGSFGEREINDEQNKEICLKLQNVGATESKFENGGKRVLDTGKKMLGVRISSKNENERQLSCNTVGNKEGTPTGLPSKNDYDCFPQQITERRKCTCNSEFNIKSTEDNDLRMEPHSAVGGNGVEEEIPETISVGDASKEPHGMSNAEYSFQKGSSLQSLESCKKGENIEVRSEPCGSSTVNTRITLASLTNPENFSTDKSDKEDQDIDYLVRATDLNHIDMEISDEEHRANVSNLRAEEKGGRYGASTPYSSISSMRNSNEPCSPSYPEEESSPYSPSHPTNVSGGDGEGNVPIRQLCHDAEQSDYVDTSEMSENITSTTNEVNIDCETVIKQVTDRKDVDSVKNPSSSIAKSRHLNPPSLTKISAQRGVKGNSNCLEGKVGKGASYVDKNAKDINEHRGPEQIHVTAKEALSSGLFDTGHLNEHKQFSSMPNDGNTVSTVTYSNNEFQQASENTFDFINQDAKMAPILPSPSAEKRLQLGDSSVGVSRPSKAAQRNLPKLIIPTKEIIERCGKGTTYSGSTTAPKENCSTKASGELNPTTKSSKLLGKVSANRNGAVNDAIDVGMGSGNVNENEMETISSPSQEKKDGLQRILNCLPTCTVTGVKSVTQHASEDSSHQDGVTFKGKFKGIKTDGLNNKLSTNNSSSFSEGVQFYRGSLSSLTTTGNTTHLVSPSFLSVENTGMENQKEMGVWTDDRANHQGSKSDWIAFKMERLRRKKKQIEQVIMISY